MTEDTGLIEPDRGCQASRLLYTTKSEHGRNRLLFSNPASVRRSNFNIRLSYDEGRTWQEVAYAAGAAVAGRLFIIGGVQDGRPSRRVLILERDASGFHWRDGPALPEARVFAEAAVVDGKIYVVGGSREFETMGAAGLCCASHTATTTVWSLAAVDPAAT